jgi:divalent metal cation (Fe/Co/Zn/Cd) transporter
MLVEAGVSLFAAGEADSVALFGFGVDSVVEIASAAIVGWRLLLEARGLCPSRVERTERAAARIAGGLLVLLAVFLLYRAGSVLLGHGMRAVGSTIGVAVTALALVVMPLLSRAKLRVAETLQSAALRADAMEATCCAWMAAAALAGLALNAALGWWWADAAAGLLLVPLLLREGAAAWRADGSCGCGH